MMGLGSKWQRLLAAGVLLASGMAAGAQQLVDSQNHHLNPAYLALSRRGLIEIGTNVGVGAYNNALALSEIFQPTLRLDMAEIAESIGEDGFRFGMGPEVGSHVAMHLFGLGVGAYGRAENLFEVTIPQSLFELIAEGNVEDRSGEGGVLIRSFAEAGAYGSLKFRRFIVGVKAAQFLPIAYSSDSDGFRYELETTEDGLRGEFGIDAAVFSALDLEAIADGADYDVTDALDNAGFKLDVGMVYLDDAGVGRWGVAANDITVVGAQTEREFRVRGSYKVEIEDAIAALIDDEDPFETTIEDLDIEDVADSDERIAKPLRLTGFYRFSFPFIDIIPQAEVNLDPRMGLLNPGITLAGNRFPTNLFYAGLERSKLLWRAGAGIRLPLYIVDLGVHVQSTSTRFGGIFDPEGLAASVNLRLGF